MKMLINLILVIVSRFIYISKHHVVHHKYTQFLFVNYTSNQNGIKKRPNSMPISARYLEIISCSCLWAHKVVACIFTVFLTTLIVFMTIHLSTPWDESSSRARPRGYGSLDPQYLSGTWLDVIHVSPGMSNEWSLNSVTPGRENDTAVW